MNYLSVDGLGKRFGEHVLFRNVRFGLQKGQRMALIARNGAGKTTLLGLLAGLDTPDEGTVGLRKDIQIGWLPQQPTFEPGQTVLQAVLAADTPARQAVAAYEAALTAAEAAPDSRPAQQALEQALAGMEKHNAWDYEADVRNVLSRLRITRLDQPVQTLSGGQQKRVALARILLQKPDLYILDEPTNHLDIDMVEWLEGYLKAQDATLLLVTHDRYFLEALCRDIIEIADQTVYHYQGSYADYLEAKAAREAAADAATASARNLLRTELEWMRRQPKARGTKSKARIEAFYDLQDKAKGRSDQGNVQLSVQMSRLGSNILTVKDLSRTFSDRPILRPFSYVFRRGERVGLVGPNGAGKSTLLNILTGRDKPDTGTVEVGETIVFGYYTQDGLHFKPGQRVIDIVKEIAEVVPISRDETVTAEQFLKRFLFEPARQYTHIEKLSGGEKRRLYLLTVLLKQPNFLILDEPTNDLDLPTLNVLEEFLDGYGGCLMVVTHDRYFLDRTVDHLLVLEPSAEGSVVRDFNGNYTDYREARAAEQEAAAQAAVPAKPAPVVVEAPAAKADPAKAKLSYKEKQEFATLETRMAELETRKEALEAQMASGNPALIQEASVAIGTVLAELEQVSDRWLELADRT